MAPTGGVPPLEDFLRLNDADLLLWTDAHVTRACFEYGLFEPTEESANSSPRARLLRFFRARRSDSSVAADEDAPPAGEDASGQARRHVVRPSSSALPVLTENQLHTPPTSPDGVGRPAAASVPFSGGILSPPARDVTPLSYEEYPEDLAAIDARDTMAEGLCLTPGRDPYAHLSEDSLSFPSDVEADDEDDQVRTRMEHRAPAYSFSRRGMRGGFGRIVPTQRVRHAKRDVPEGSPGGMPAAPPAARRLGDTPVRVRQLPTRPFGRRFFVPPPIGEDADVSMESGASSADDSPPPVDQRHQRPLPDFSAPFGATLPLSPHPAPPTQGTILSTSPVGAPRPDGGGVSTSFPRVSKLGWARLAQLPGRPSKRQLLTLKPEDLKALVSFNGLCPPTKKPETMLQHILAELLRCPTLFLSVPSPPSPRRPAARDRATASPQRSGTSPNTGVSTFPDAAPDPTATADAMHVDGESAAAVDHPGITTPGDDRSTGPTGTSHPAATAHAARGCADDSSHPSLRTAVPLGDDDAPPAPHGPPFATWNSQTHCQLSSLPDRPSAATLADLNDVALKVVMAVNGFRRTNRGIGTDFRKTIAEWLAADSTRVLRRHPQLSPRHSASVPGDTDRPARPVRSAWHPGLRRPPVQPSSSMPGPQSTHTDPRPTPPPGFAELSTLLHHAGHTMERACAVGRAAHAGTLDRDDAIALGTEAQTVLLQLQAAAAGLAAAHLLPQQPQPPPPSGAATQRTWADVAKHADQGPSNDRHSAPGPQNGRTSAQDKPGRQHGRQSSTINPDWDLNRCLVLEPAFDSQRTTPTAGPRFAAAMDAHLRRLAEDIPARSVELVRRTRRGGYQVQFFAQCFPRVQSLLGSSSVMLPHFGTWTMTPRWTDPAGGPSVSIVVQGVPVDVTKEEFLAELRLGIASRLSVSGDPTCDGIRSASRLQRRITTSSGKAWAPSRTIRVDVSQALGEALLTRGTIVYQFRSLPVRRFTPMTRTCFRCGKEGHEARFCRSTPRCRHCGRDHETRACRIGRRRPSSPDRAPSPEPESQSQMRDRGPTPPMPS